MDKSADRSAIMEDYLDHVHNKKAMKNVFLKSPNNQDGIEMEHRVKDNDIMHFGSVSTNKPSMKGSYYKMRKLDSS